MSFLRFASVLLLFSYCLNLSAQEEWININDPVTGEELYPACAFCHGSAAQGNDRRDGPALAGLQAWYIEKQLYKFRDGLRGYLEVDIPGQTMHGSTLMLRNDETIKSISNYIASLEPGQPADRNSTGLRPYVWDTPYAQLSPGVTGNVEAGAKVYTTVCVACHLADGAGNEVLGAGSLKYLSKAYMERQLQYFKEGVRGAHPEDTTGQQMAAMSKMLPDDQAIADVVAYILSL